MKVFLDSNIIQHSATTYRTCEIRFGGVKAGEPLVRMGKIETVVKPALEPGKLKEEIACLPSLASELKKVGAYLVTTRENFSEVRNAGKFRSDYFYGSEIAFADPPPEPYWSVIMPSWLNAGPTKNQFHNYLHRLKYPRFLEIAKYAGAIHEGGYNYGQMADAYFLWCAEVNQVDYFLTLDMKLQRSMERSPTLSFKPKVITASALLHRFVRG